MSSSPEAVSFWNQRAALGPEAGTRDRIAKALEVAYLMRAVERLKPQSVLDAGCGDGETLASLHAIYGFRHAVGIDTSGAMLAHARRRFEEAARVFAWPGDYPLETAPAPLAIQRDIRELTHDSGRCEGELIFTPQWDLVYTERAIINCGEWADQRRAIESLQACVTPGGELILLECSLDGLNRLNDLRDAARLPAIAPPAHCRYLRHYEMAADAGFYEPSVGYSDAYYLASRVLNASIAAALGEEPDYQSPINLAALHYGPCELPALRCGQGRAWHWRKEGTHAEVRSAESQS